MPKKRFTEVVVEAADVMRRLDIFIAEKMASQHSRSHLQKMIKNGGVLVDGKNVTPHYRVKEGEKVHVENLDLPQDDIPAEAIPVSYTHLTLPTNREV